jgi:hypothetical protein
MAISRVGSASAQATTITIPTHQSGDLILIVANRNNSTAATIPSGWVVLNNSGASGVSISLAWKIAQSSSETSGTWTNASAMHCAVYRGSVGSLVMNLPVGAATGNSTTVFFSTLASGLVYRTGQEDNWYIGTAIQLNSANSLETAPSGMSNIHVESSSGVWKSVLHDTNASQLSNWSSVSITVANTAQYISRVAQIFEFAAPAGGGGGFRPVNIRGGADQ